MRKGSLIVLVIALAVLGIRSTALESAASADQSRNSGVSSSSTRWV
jgi:hypothetical protein